MSIFWYFFHPIPAPLSVIPLHQVDWVLAISTHHRDSENRPDQSINQWTNPEFLRSIPPISRRISSPLINNNSTPHNNNNHNTPLSNIRHVSSLVPRTLPPRPRGPSITSTRIPTATPDLRQNVRMVQCHWLKCYLDKWFLGSTTQWIDKSTKLMNIPDRW